MLWHVALYKNKFMTNAKTTGHNSGIVSTAHRDDGCIVRWRQYANEYFIEASSLIRKTDAILVYKLNKKYI